MKVFTITIIAVFFIEHHNVFSQVIFPTSRPNTLCQTSSGSVGKCHPGFQCPESVSGKNKFCLQGLGRVSVCCPLKLEPIITNDKIVEAPETVPSCGKREKIPIIFASASALRVKRTPARPTFKLEPSLNEVAVVGGHISYKNSWPWMVLLGKKRGPSNIYFCSAVLLNQDYVLTAAHCVLEPDPFFARFGEHDYNNPSVSMLPEDIDVKDVIFHPKYKVDRGYYDMALLKLSKPVTFRKEVKPVCLPWGTLANEDLIKKKVTVTGWGSVEFGGQPSRVLREVILEVFEPKVCEESYSKLPDFVTDYPEGMNKTTIVCAGDKSGGKDTCQGDSGGPMVAEGSNGIYNLVGIVSKGYGCGLKDFPGIYTPLRNYETLLWIKNTAF